MDKNLVQVTPFNLLSSGERGATYDFALCRQQQEFIYLTRKKGSLSGNTYHEGLSQATQPKIFLLLQGTILLSYRKIETTTAYSQNIEAPAQIEIQPFVTHNVEAITDILMMECNAIADIEQDRRFEEV
tara:strand:+ start:455 stop:841 length:387 start_codon:yes stop_codon:yes gene_type:complete